MKYNKKTVGLPLCQLFVTIRYYRQATPTLQGLKYCACVFYFFSWNNNKLIALQFY